MEVGAIAWDDFVKIPEIVTASLNYFEKPDNDTVTLRVNEICIKEDTIVFSICEKIYSSRHPKTGQETHKLIDLTDKDRVLTIPITTKLYHWDLGDPKTEHYWFTHNAHNYTLYPKV